MSRNLSISPSSPYNYWRTLQSRIGGTSTHFIRKNIHIESLCHQICCYHWPNCFRIIYSQWNWYEQIRHTLIGDIRYRIVLINLLDPYNVICHLAHASIQIVPSEMNELIHSKWSLNRTVYYRWFILKSEFNDQKNFHWICKWWTAFNIFSLLFFIFLTNLCTIYMLFLPKNVTWMIKLMLLIYLEFNSLIGEESVHSENDFYSCKAFNWPNSLS